MDNIINIQNYTYDLPSDKIANHPLSNRDEAKLLVYNKGKIEHTSFKSMVDLLPTNSLLFFNDTKVIPARIHFQKDSGADIEIFLLSPVKPSTLMADVMLTSRRCTWQCTIGNLKRWKDGQLLQKELKGISLTATLVNRSDGLVEFNWSTQQSFAEVVTALGVTPLPPYIKREASVEDVTRYQTVYSRYEGAVAAPTAGLHFTDQILEGLSKKGIEKFFLTLHVSAGTFQPVKTENALEHTMHREQIVITKAAVQNLLLENKFIVAVGTTSMRTLESIYWFGVKLLADPHSEFSITQFDPYAERKLPSRDEALQCVLKYMIDHSLTVITGSTAIFIYPGYKFKICNGLITNFHLPASTLILLVAAFIGNDWEKIYNEALQNDYRFLSYGDSSLLIP
jgi:S-adenosylmethionine:tRNA ribosyltransferase-isomerase